MFELDVVIMDFHDLSFRYQQFEDAIAKAELFKAMRATHVIAEPGKGKTGSILSVDKK
jgi:hypothetical protein